MQNINNKRKSKRKIRIISGITLILAIIYGGIKAYPDIVAMKTYSDIKRSFNESTGDDKLLIAWRLCDSYEMWSQEYTNVNDSILEEKLSKEYESTDIGLRNNALNFITDEAKNENAYAQYILGWLYKYNSCVPNDLEKSAYWTNEAAKQNYPKALGEMGINYLYGYGVENNIRMAVILFTKGTELNDSQSQYNLGCFYRDAIYAETETDWEVKIDKDWGEEGGFRRCTRYFENDSLRIDFHGTEVYHIEGLIPHDINKAKALWRKAAQQGNSDAQKSLEKVYD